uniref:UBP-type domain-containing protein n=1 Tax=Ciona savignyi TaxID=51511 RepID=H2ZET7_CIOSA
MVCGSSEDLWICLVCGNVGCGRYTSEHAQQHYLETHHNYAMALSDNRVWDYAGDYFVHRLFQNKEDGKLIEKGGSDENEAKIEGIQLECMHLLTSQLESQRKYWEEMVDQAQAQGAKKYEDVCSELEQAMSQLQVTNKKVEELGSERQSLSHRNLQLSNKFTQTLRDLSNERELNKSLIKNQEMWRKKVVDVEEVASKQQVEITELKEQLRDVMFYIEASQAIKKEDGQVQDDIRDGTVVVGPSTSSDSNRRRKKQR